MTIISQYFLNKIESKFSKHVDILNAAMKYYIICFFHYNKNISFKNINFLKISDLYTILI